MSHNIEIGCMLDKEGSEEIYKYLVRLPRWGRLVETGTGWGHSSQFFSKVLPNWIIYTVDAFGMYGDGRIYNGYKTPDVKKIIDQHPENVIQILGDSKAVPWELPIDVLYLDADHTFEGCKADYLRYGPYLDKGGLLIFDDYRQDNNPANGVKQVVDSIEGYKILYTGICAIMKKE